MSARDDIPEEKASVLIERVFRLLGECRTVICELEQLQPTAERSAQAKRDVYTVLLGLLEAGLVRTMDEAIDMLEHAGQPLGPRGEEWLRRQEQTLEKLDSLD